MNKKGFTLIELLAVIVIVIIIATITVPIILNIIKNSKEKATIDSAYGYINAVENYFLKENLVDGKKIVAGTYDVSSEKAENGTSYEPLNGLVALKGTLPKFGKINLNDKGIITSAVLCIDNYLIEYTGVESNIIGNDCSDVDKVPLVAVSDTSYATTKTVTITYPEGDYKKHYQLKQGSAQVDSQNLLLNKDYTTTKTNQPVKFTSNGKLDVWLENSRNVKLKTFTIEETKIDTTTPIIDLSSVPTSFSILDDYTVPTKVTYGLSGGSVSCKVGSTSLTNTKTLAIGTNQTITCTATSNTGIESTSMKTVTVTAPKCGEGKSCVWGEYVNVQLNSNTTGKFYVYSNSSNTNDTVVLIYEKNYGSVTDWANVTPATTPDLALSLLPTTWTNATKVRIPTSGELGTRGCTTSSATSACKAWLATNLTGSSPYGYWTLTAMNTVQAYGLYKGASNPAYIWEFAMKSGTKYYGIRPVIEINKKYIIS